MNLRKISALCALVCTTFVAQASQPTALVSWGSEHIPPLPADTKFKAISSGVYHNLAILSNNTVVAWGMDHGGQCRVPTGLSNVVAVSAGGVHSLALKSDGTVVGWGDNSSRVLDIPVGLSNVVAIAAGRFQSLALKADGTVVSWPQNSPVPEGVSNVVAIAAGYRRSVALQADGTVIGWGEDISPTIMASNIVAITDVLGLKDDGTLTGFWGVNTTHPRPHTNIVAITSSVHEPTRSYRSHIALQSDGTVWQLFTDETTGHFGDASFYYKMPDISAIAVSHSHFLFLKQDGTLFTQGDSSYSQAVLPTQFNDVTAIAAGYRHQVALKKDGTIFVWGEGIHGQLYVPADLTNVVAVAAGGTFTAALKADGRVHVTGSLVGWQSIATLTNVVAIAGGDFHAVFLDARGKVWSYGMNTEGQLNIPAGLSNVVAIAAGAAHSVALRADGTAIAWGKISQDFTNYNDIASIDASMLLRSNGTTVHFGRGEYQMSPVSNAVAISSGRDHELILTREGTVISGGIAPYNIEFNQTYVAPEVKHVLTIEAGWGKSFAIVSIAPEIRSQVNGGNLVLSWPVSTKNYELQTTSDVSAANSWVAAEGDVVVENYRNTYTLPVSGEQRFFRLVSAED